MAMQSSALPLSSSPSHVLKPRRTPDYSISSFRIDGITNLSLSSSSEPFDLISTRSLSWSAATRFHHHTTPLSVPSSFNSIDLMSSSSTSMDLLSLRPSLISTKRRRRGDFDFSLKATSSVPDEDEAQQESSNLIETLTLGGLFGLWYMFNIYFNIYNKQVLEVFHFPLTVTAAHFAIGSVLVILMWTLNLYKRPKISTAQLAAILPLAVVHTLGNLFTNVSLGKVAVSFTHTVKATEPFFSVAFSALFMGEMPTPWVVLSLLPIMGGVALASLTEVSFNWPGFWSAMASNVANQSRNVLSKKLMGKQEESLDNITLFSIITIMSFILLAPAAVVMEGVKYTPSFMEAAGLNVKQVFIRSLLAALWFHGHQQVSYMILERVSPVTHSVGNCVKRVVVIISSLVFFKSPVSLMNSVGTGIALSGVFLYSRVNSIKAKPKAA